VALAAFLHERGQLGVGGTRRPRGLDDVAAAGEEPREEARERGALLLNGSASQGRPQRRHFRLVVHRVEQREQDRALVPEHRIHRRHRNARLARHCVDRRRREPARRKQPPRRRDDAVARGPGGALPDLRLIGPLDGTHLLIVAYRHSLKFCYI
jgi:hypothetical protein